MVKLQSSRVPTTDQPSPFRRLQQFNGVLSNRKVVILEGVELFAKRQERL